MNISSSLASRGRRTHFMLFAGVIWPNIVLSSRIAVYAVSVSSGLSVAVPKYSFPAAFATVCSLAVDVEAEPLALEVLVGGFEEELPTEA